MGARRAPRDAGLAPGVEGGILADEGHLTLFANRIADVHGWLLTRSTVR